MTCAHVLGLIDAGPFADYPGAHLDAAWQHARQCPTCGPALETATALTSDLAALPQPAPPSDLAAAVLARITEIDRPAAAVTAVPRARARLNARDWSSALATALGSLAAGAATALSMHPGNAAPTAPAWLGMGQMTAGLEAVPPTSTWALVLAAGLVVYAAGLFAPLGGGSDQL